MTVKYSHSLPIVRIGFLQEVNGIRDRKCYILRDVEKYRFNVGIE